ncbi:RUN domain-containing protein [Reticulomyxa filosa]|uniref:RUN domain-containing protein n=1 Tax=Reticulomyxa filosa TaxID=46433 RepID=X6MCG9_RETFI|nr:RUN domain-containing protein [Reticulomyxa filosa]|eukprot:ETO11142.1 RUN domain-containing protein [Reticulomyxa filosa]
MFSESSIGQDARRIIEDVAREEGVSMEYEAKPNARPGEGRKSRPPSRRCSFLKNYQHPYLDKAVTGETIEERGRLISRALYDAIQKHSVSKVKDKTKKTHPKQNKTISNERAFDVFTKDDPSYRHTRTKKYKPTAVTSGRKPGGKAVNNYNSTSEYLSNIAVGQIPANANTSALPSRQNQRLLQSRNKSTKSRQHKTSESTSFEWPVRTEMSNTQARHHRQSSNQIPARSLQTQAQTPSGHVEGKHQPHSFVANPLLGNNNNKNNNNNDEDEDEDEDDHENIPFPTFQKKSSMSQPASPKNVHETRSYFEKSMKKKELDQQNVCFVFNTLLCLLVIVNALETRDQQTDERDVDSDLKQDEGLDPNLEMETSKIGFASSTQLLRFVPRDELLEQQDISSERPDLAQFSQSFKVVPSSSSPSKYFQRHNVSPIKFRSRHRASMWKEGQLDRPQSSDAATEENPVPTTSMTSPMIDSTNKTILQSTPVGQSKRSNTANMGHGIGISARARTPSQETKVKKIEDGLAAKAQHNSFQSQAGPNSAKHHNFNNGKAANDDFEKNSPVDNEETSSISPKSEEMKPRIHQALVRQAKHKKYMDSQRLYNRPRVSISVPVSPHHSDDEPNENENTTPRKKYAKLVPNMSAGRAPLEEVDEEASEFTKDDRNVSQKKNNNMADIHNSEDDDNETNMVYVDNQMTIEDFKAEIQEYEIIVFFCCYLFFFLVAAKKVKEIMILWLTLTTVPLFCCCEKKLNNKALGLMWTCIFMKFLSIYTFFKYFQFISRYFQARHLNLENF